MSESNGNGKPKPNGKPKAAKKTAKKKPTAKSMFGSIRHPKKRAFLNAMSETFHIVQSAKAAGIDRQTHYNWLKGDPDYAAAYEHARDLGADALEAELTRRAKEGNRKYKFHNGKPQMVCCNADHEDAIAVAKDGRTVYVRHYYEVEQSDVLGIFLMKGAKPEKYRERYEVKDHVDDDELNRDIQRRLDQLATRKAATLPGAAGTSGSGNGNGAKR